MPPTSYIPMQSFGSLKGIYDMTEIAAIIQTEREREMEIAERERGIIRVIWAFLDDQNRSPLSIKWDCLYGTESWGH